MTITDTITEQRIAEIAREIAAEVARAERKHKPLNSPHEGYAVILEELDELWEHVRADTGRSREARKEAIQIAAMGLRYVLNVCAGPDRRPIRHRLAEFYTEDEIEKWLFSPHPQLGGNRPWDIVTYGRKESVHEVIDRLAGEAYL